MNIFLKPAVAKIKKEILQYPELTSFEEYLEKERLYTLTFFSFCSVVVLILLGAMVSLSDTPGIYLAFGLWIGFFVKHILELGLLLKTPLAVKNEVWSFYTAQKIRQQEEDNHSHLLTSYLSNPKTFCREHFKKSGSGFLSFFQERALISGEVQADFIYYALSIPRRKMFSVDSFRKILLAYQPLNLGHPMEWEWRFQDYTSTEIERIFTSPYNRKFLTVLPQSVLPVEKDFLTLEDKLTEQYIPERFKELHNKIINGLHFKVLISKKDYENASLNFSNCLKSYWDQGLVVVTVFVGAMPLGCASIKDKKLQEIKGVNNQSCPERDKIIEILQERYFI